MTGSQASRTAGSSAAFRLISGPMPAGSPTGIAILIRSPIAALQPRHQRSVDHVRHAFAADRLDCLVDLVQAEAMRCHELQRKALRGKLLQRELAGAVAVAARALHGDELHGELLQREVRELAKLALRHDDAGLALERLDAKQDRDGAGAGGAVERHVDALAAGDFHDAGERVFLVHVDDMVGAEFLGDLEPRLVLRCAGDDDERRAGLLADHGLRQALLARPLNEDGGVVADAAVEQRPLDAVRHRRDETGELRRNALRYVMDHRIPRQIDILREAPPQMRRLLGRGVAVANGVWVGAPVGVLAVAILAGVTPLALAARYVVLDEDKITFLEALALGELAAGFGDDADVL